MKHSLTLLAAVLVAIPVTSIAAYWYAMKFLESLEDAGPVPMSDIEWDAFARAHAIPEADLL